MFRELGEKLTDLDLTEYPAPGQWLGFRFGMWLLKKTEPKDLTEPE